MPITVNDNVKDLKKLLTFALREANANSDDAAFALAQLLGILAAKMDQRGSLVPFEERWKEITEVAEVEYHKVKIDARRPVLVSDLGSVS